MVSVSRRWRFGPRLLPVGGLGTGPPGDICAIPNHGARGAIATRRPSRDPGQLPQAPAARGGRLALRRLEPSTPRRLDAGIRIAAIRALSLQGTQDRQTDPPTGGPIRPSFRPTSERCRHSDRSADKATRRATQFSVPTACVPLKHGATRPDKQRAGVVWGDSTPCVGNLYYPTRPPRRADA